MDTKRRQEHVPNAPGATPVHGRGCQPRPPPDALDRPLVADPHTTDATRSLSSPPPEGIGDNGPTLDQPKDNGPNLIDTVIADRYKLRQEIGEGGMGTVYLAEQLRPVRRQVALKLIKPGMDSRNVLARFDSEGPRASSRHPLFPRRGNSDG